MFYVLPTKLVYIWLLVEVVAVLANVVQLGVDGGFILAMAVLRHSSVTLARKTELKLRQRPIYSFSFTLRNLITYSIQYS